MKIYNTLTKKKEELKTIEDKKVKIYSCGPTVYDYAHIGNLRTYIFMDVFRKTLKYNGYEIKHVMNITDVGHLVSDDDVGEDKMVVTAKKLKKTPLEISKMYTKAFLRDIEKLNIEKPEIIPRATEHISEMIEFVKGLYQKGYAYETSDGIYFDITKYNEYGQLSNIDLEEQMAGARVCVNDEKKHPADFALWKKAPKNHIMQWESPWGMGYPGWHIECSAMSRKYLGDTFDIHTGGVDAIPVHHENEIAQSRCLTGKPMANYFVHGEFLLVDNGKMSKSLGNTYTIDELEKRGYDALDYRYFCLNANYRNKLNFTFEALDGAKKSRKRLMEGLISHKNAEMELEQDKIDEVTKEFKVAINDDLNIPYALGLLWNLVRNNEKSQDIYNLVIDMDKVLGLRLNESQKLIKDEKTINIPKEITILADKRQKAREDKDYELADNIRDKIDKKGYYIKDTKTGPEILKK